MSKLRFITASLRYYRRIHLAVAMGVATATAVLSGALLVGDSVRGSLRELTLQRLGRIDSALVTTHLFRAALADELAAQAAFQQHFAAAEPLMLMGGILQSSGGTNARRATSVSVIGCRASFWSLGSGGPPQPLGNDEVALTETLARELNVKAGDELLLRIPRPRAIPSDSPLGEKSDVSLARRLKIAAVLPPNGLARFGLVPSQHLPRNAFLRLETLQQLMEKPGLANAIVVATANLQTAAEDAARLALQSALRPQLSDYGLRVEWLSSPVACVQISADQLVLPDEVVRAAERAFGKDSLQPVITYLANTLMTGEGDKLRKIPYSTITGVDSTAELGPLLDEQGVPIRLKDDEIVLNRWAADDLGAEVGDEVTVTFYEPESTHGRLREHHPPPVFRLRGIVPLEITEERTSPAADPKLTPELPGVTDQKSIEDWDLPFELVEKIRPQDEEYWDKYRTTPKAFVSLNMAKQLWSSRWGTISLLRIPSSAFDGQAASIANVVADQLGKAINPAALGMTFLPVKQQGLDAARGTTPFDALFLVFSFFLIAATLMLIALLFQLGVEQRASELGTLAAMGIDHRCMASLLGREGLVVATLGSSVGAALGVLYAGIIIVGLRSWWLAATGTPFVALHVGWKSLAIGWLAGTMVSWITLRLSIRRLVRQSPRALLTGTTFEEGNSAEHGRSGRSARSTMALWPILRLALAILAIGLCLAGFYLQYEAQTGIFFGSGTAVLLLLLGELRFRLSRSRRGAAIHHRFAIETLAALNTARHPRRSTLTVGLVAAASFLIVAVSAFRLETTDAGTGGFEFLATSDLPIHYDLNSPEGRLELGFSEDDDKELEAWRVYALRMAAGEDASCLNLYQPMQPRVLGVPDALIQRGGFAWASSILRHDRTANEWDSLHAVLGQDQHGRTIVPVVLDANTAVYSLRLRGLGDRMTIRDSAGQEATLEVVGLLKNSVLQGTLLMSEANFLRLFPNTGGYRFFLIERRDGTIAEATRKTGSGGRSSMAWEHLARGEQEKVVQILETRLGDEGFDVVDARERLAAYLAVQNTYLSTFQSLGALGLALGTIGLAVVQVRSVLERRGELALMRAGGFPRSRLALMVVLENGVLLLGGLAIGCMAAAVTLIPHWVPQQAGIPWTALVGLLGTIFVVGLTAGWLATRSILRAPIVPALRGD